MFSQIGPLEIVLVLVIVLVIFGPKRLPGLGKQLGTGLREFKESVTGEKRDDEDPPHVESPPPPAPTPALTAARVEDEATASTQEASEALGRPAGD
jgi:sec-independent protein translocase protein TatA